MNKKHSITYNEGYLRSMKYYLWLKIFCIFPGFLVIIWMGISLKTILFILLPFYCILIIVIYFHDKSSNGKILKYVRFSNEGIYVWKLDGTEENILWDNIVSVKKTNDNDDVYVVFFRTNKFFSGNSGKFYHSEIPLDGETGRIAVAAFSQFKQYPRV